MSENGQNHYTCKVSVDRTFGFVKYTTGVAQECLATGGWIYNIIEVKNYLNDFFKC